MLNSSCSDESFHPAPTPGREPTNATIVPDKGVGESTELQDEQESGHPATIHDEEHHSAAVQEKESSTSDGIGDTTSPEIAEMVDQPKKRPKIVSL